MSIKNKTAVEISKMIKDRQISAVEVLEQTIQQIKEKDEKVKGFITVDEDVARKQAQIIQKGIEKGELTGPLAGVPIAIKDNIDTKGIKTTCASKILYNFVPTFDATAVKNLKDAGAIIVGKTNMDEFAMGSTSETSAFATTRNPWDLTKVPGGSSGGTCAVVASGQVSCGLGSDTGGSIRQPSSYCGVTGIKPTYGTVSRYGLIAYGSSLDQIGPVARNVADCATILETISSYDRFDSTSMKRDKYDFTSALDKDVKGMRIGIPKEYLEKGIDDEVKQLLLLHHQFLFQDTL